MTMAQDAESTLLMKIVTAEEEIAVRKRREIRAVTEDTNRVAHSGEARPLNRFHLTR
jgi:hypothetical protein